MAIPLLQTLMVGSYVVRQQLTGRKRYPLVLMLEPLFRCNLACAGCGKIDYPDEILNQRISVADALAGGRRMRRAGGLDRRRRAAAAQGDAADRRGHHRAASKFVYLCTNALLMEKKIEQYKPSPFFVWSVHLDGDKEMHDKSVCQDGVYDRAVEAIKAAKAMGFRVNINCTLFNNAEPERVAAFFDDARRPWASTASRCRPAMPTSARRTSSTSSTAPRPSSCSATSSGAAMAARNWSFSQSSLFLDFLAGNQTYHCTPWGNPTRTVFGWQRPCYLLGEGYAKTFTRADGRDRLGRLRHRQLREVRRLHGALAASRRPPSTTPSRIRSRPRSPRSAGCAPKAPWCRKFRCTPSARRNTCSSAR